MFKMKYDVWSKNGKQQFVLVPMADYRTICQRLEDDADFRAIEASKKRQAGSARTSLEQLKRELGFTRGRKNSRK
ncbi:MAG: hypothetical protein ABSG31_05450 [Tepidisphaeraceae bacterium]|jgi:hypothetical protein